MRVLALEPYHGGSHRAFLDGWAAASRHAWTVLGLPANKWKWRMRHGAVSLADAAAERLADGAGWDLVFATDMLALAEFRGLAPEAVRTLPAVFYFHENQLTYPDRRRDPRDLHFGFTNLTAALAADAVWFNSAFHRDGFLDAARQLLKRMPSRAPKDLADRIAAKASVQPPGVPPIAPATARTPGPLRILWAARWEHDKRPETFFAAVDRLADAGVDFRLNVVGETFADAPPVFEAARTRHADRIDRWGWQETRADYEAVLRAADVAVSTAAHEFFGLGMVEAAAAGALPVLPRRLAYPEVFADPAGRPVDAFFYDGTVEGLAASLAGCAERLAEAGSVWPAGLEGAGRRVAARYAWPARAPALDDGLERPKAPSPSGRGQG